MNNGTIITVDPTTLTIAVNVRTDVKLDKGFIASIKELGILQPPMVTSNGEGGYDVVLGQRRTLAAVEAGLLEIPVYLVDKSEADAARVVDQLTENDQRQGLSESERVGGYKRLSLFGVTPAQIAKRTASDRKTVDKALAVADDEVASGAMSEYQLTLDEASFIVEFSDDEAAVKALVTAAAGGTLAHEVAGLRTKRDLRLSQAQLAAELVAEKVIVMLPSSSAYGRPQEGDPAGLVRVDKLGSLKDATEPLEISEVPKKALAGRVVTDFMSTPGGGYGKQAAKQYFVLNPEVHGIPERSYQRAEVPLTEEQVAARAKRDEEDRARQEAKATRQAAAEVRWAWVSEFMQRKTLPEFFPFVVRMLAQDDIGLSAAAFELLGVAADESTDRAVVTSEFLAQHPEAADRLILAVALAEAEHTTNPSKVWVEVDLEVASIYLTQLDVWGYGLSAYEHELLAAASEAALADGDDVDEEYGDEFEDDEE